MMTEMPENLIETSIEELRVSEIPIFIWGGGQTAGKIKEYLADRGIMVDGFLINKEYFNSEEKELHGLPVYVLEDYLVSHICNLIIGFSGYQESKFDCRLSNVHKQYVLDFIGALCLEGSCNMISHKFYEENRQKLEWLESVLADNRSRFELQEFIAQRMSGTYKKVCYETDQYFPKDIICLDKGEVFVDCGAYLGESAIDFIGHIDESHADYRRIICIEADEDNAAKLKYNVQQYKNIEIVPAAVWDREDTLRMDSGSKISENGTTIVEAKTIDGILDGSEATYIKMDVEGAELRALYGAAETIKKYKPKLAICIYHKPEDIIQIPSYIYRLRNDYKLYIRNHSPYGIETVLYAV